MYAHAVNPDEPCQPKWIRDKLGLQGADFQQSFLTDLLEKYQENQDFIDDYLSKFLDKEYATLDTACACILKCLVVERLIDARMPVAVAVNEAVNLAHEFASEGYQIVNALAEKLWNYPLNLPTGS